MQYAPGFASLSLPSSVLKGIHFMGYKEPTPIQKAAIPPLMEGRDVVAMARTGSGKTAAFAIPLILKLNCTHSIRVGARAIILSPTRELAIQTHSFIERLCKKSNSSLRTACLLGGDSISEQFSMLMANPDILIGTPGRLLHLFAETSGSISQKEGNLLSAVQFVVLDEADRLFEDQTSAAQISLLFSRLPPVRQVALFSATMPGQLLVFSKTGLKDPVSIRLDADLKLSDNLKTFYFDAQVAEKPAMLLKLLEDTDSPLLTFSSSEPGGMVFVATRHIADFLSGILTSAGIKHGVLFGKMDAEARKIVLESFRIGESPLLIVTDIASRGIDIPSLQFVINYDFPSTPKLFVHRAGRVARAGRSGTLISFISVDERPFLMELQSFQGLSEIQLYRLTSFGDSALEDIKSRIESYISLDADLGPLSQVAKQSLLKYQRTRPKASPAAYAKAKAMPGREMIPVFKASPSDTLADASDFMAQLSSFRPSETVFEAMRKGSRGERSLTSAPGLASIAALRSKKQSLSGQSKKILCPDHTFADEKSFVGYEKTTCHLEKGLEVAFTLPNDDGERNLKKCKLTRQWDPKKKRFVNVEAHVSEEKLLEKSLFGPQKPTETAVPNPKKLQVGQVYKDWKKTTHQQLPRVGSIESPESQSSPFISRPRGYRRRKFQGARSLPKIIKQKNHSKVKSELKNMDQIIKARSKKAAISKKLAEKKSGAKNKAI